ncbi:hypothetical protein [Vreelandella alkaliphila]|uniref:Uncharacterized protein n=1 Tax=Vreelandella alkaliphila TaxID=272774 RepID=A0AAJ2S2K3_9GAMM|nr:hypothetical protein [Halomonas alkaliphila]MDX5979642.1 hypothetical protein [Halomonas alkaliphila]
MAGETHILQLESADSAALARQAEAAERQAEALESLAETAVAAVENLTAIATQFQRWNDIASDRDRGVYMNPNMKEDRYKDHSESVSRAAFDVSMEETNKVEAVKSRMRNPVDWSI